MVSGPAPAGTGTKDTLAGTLPVSNEQSIYNSLMGFFRRKGFSVANARVATAAFLGNFKIESGFSPTAYNPNENAHGYGQWENGRWSGPHGLQAYARNHHLNPLSPAAEQGYLQYELTHGFAPVVDALRGVGNIDSATQIVQARFEISDPGTLGARQSAARSIYADIRAGRPLRGGPLTRTNSTTSSVGATGGAAAAGAAGFAGGPASSFDPLGPLSNVIDGTFLKNLGHWMIDAFLIIAGAIMIIVALTIVARSSGVDVTSNNEPDDAHPGAGVEHKVRDAAAAATV